MKARAHAVPALILAILMSGPATAGAAESPPAADAVRVANPFFAMVTGTKTKYPGSDTSPEAQLDLLKELGYAGIAWTIEAPAESARVAAEAEKRGLKMFAIYCGVTLTRGGIQPDPRLHDTIGALKGRGTILWLHITSSDFPKSSAEGDEAALPGLRDLANRAATNGLQVAIYPHLGDWTERVEDAVRVANKVGCPNFGVTFNLCHWLRADGKDLDRRLGEAMPHLFCVTINGASPEAGSGWDVLIQTLDTGGYDWPGLVRNLAARGFKGPIGLQLYGVGGDRRDNLDRSIKAWQKAFGPKGE